MHIIPNIQGFSDLEAALVEIKNGLREPIRVSDEDGNLIDCSGRLFLTNNDRTWEGHCYVEHGIVVGLD